MVQRPAGTLPLAALLLLLSSAALGMGRASGAGATEKAGPAHAAGPERFTSALALRLLPEFGLVVRFLLPQVLLPTDREPAREESHHAALVNT